MPNALKISPATNTAPQAPPPPRGCQWIDIATACQRMNRDGSTLRKRCANEWLHQGFARLVDGAWQIREDADPGLARVPIAGAIVEDLNHLTNDARNKAFWKKTLIAAWETFSNSEQCRGFTQEQVDTVFLELLEAGKLAVKLMPGMKYAPTDRTLRRWRKNASAGVSLLVDGRSTRYQDEPPAGDNDPFFECVKDLYLVQQAPDLTFVHKMATYQAARNGWTLRSLSQTRRFVDSIPLGVIEMFRGGPKNFNDKCAPYIPRDYTTLRVNQIWNADHHRFDVMVTHQGKTFRPWLTAIQEVRSRMIVGWQITNGGNTQSILAALARAVDGHGIPEQVYFDLGRDFCSRAIGGVSRRQLFKGKRKDADPEMVGACGMLGVEVVNCQPYHGQSKPIERFFGTMEQFAKSNPTYCGNRPANRPENLAARLKRNAAPELADFVEYFRLWVNWHNECHEHHGDGMEGRSPAAVFDSLITEKRAVDPDIRQLIFWKPVIAKMGRNGVTCNHLVYSPADDLVWRDWQGKEVSIRVNPSDANHAAVHDPKGRFLCMAKCVERLGWDAGQDKVAAAIAANKRKVKLIREYHTSRPRLASSIGEEMQLQQIEENRRLREAQKAAPPLVMVSTPLDGQHQQIKRALATQAPMRLADPIDAPTPSKKDAFVALGRFFYDPPPREEEQQPSSLREWMEWHEKKQEAERAAAEPAEDPFETMTRVFQEREGKP